MTAADIAKFLELAIQLSAASKRCAEVNPAMSAELRDQALDILQFVDESTRSRNDDPRAAMEDEQGRLHLLEPVDARSLGRLAEALEQEFAIEVDLPEPVTNRRPPGTRSDQATQEPKRSSFLLWLLKPRSRQATTRCLPVGF